MIVVLPNLDHGVSGSNPAGDEINFDSQSLRYATRHNK